MRNCRAMARRVRALGLWGKICALSKQVKHLLASFCLNADEVAWARKVLASGEVAAMAENAMVDKPVRLPALQITGLATGEICLIPEVPDAKWRQVLSA
jgi:citrate lyase subunit beta/citryl-CoA lyase